MKTRSQLSIRNIRTEAVEMLDLPRTASADMLRHWRVLVRMGIAKIELDRANATTTYTLKDTAGTGRAVLSVL